MHRNTFPFLTVTVTAIVAVKTAVIVEGSGAFSVFIQPQLLTNGGPNGSTSTIALYLVDQVKNANYGRAAALGVLIAVFGMLIVSMVRWVMEQRESVEM